MWENQMFRNKSSNSFYAVLKGMSKDQCMKTPSFPPFRLNMEIYSINLGV